MTKKDYEMIAAAIRGATSDVLHVLFASNGSADTKTIAEAIARAFADHLVATNPRFDTERFVRACTGEDERPHAKVRRSETLKAGKRRVSASLRANAKSV